MGDTGDSVNEPDLDDLSALASEPTPAEPLDDLSALVSPTPTEELDDLWSLIEEGAPAKGAEDNLWDLVPTQPEEEDLDNLWELVDEAPGGELDNLWELVDDAPLKSDKQPMSDTGLDDLWTTDEPGTASPEPEETLDNLWELVDTPRQEEPPVRPKEPPARRPAANSENKMAAPSFPTDPEGYKDFILKEIIGMKRREGLSAGQVAARLNEEEKPTFSGKGAWGARTIEGIFKIIEKAGPS